MCLSQVQSAQNRPTVAPVTGLPASTPCGQSRHAEQGQCTRPRNRPCEVGDRQFTGTVQAVIGLDVKADRVAGIHRLLAYHEKIMAAHVLIVVAGMEGALPSVVSGLVDRPVIAVPTSVGYGTSFGGITALLAMLNSCASGVTVVNIDNGFGAGYAASLMNRL